MRSIDALAGFISSGDESASLWRAAGVKDRGLSLKRDALTGGRESGLTAIELMMVITIIAILSSVAIPSYRSYFYKNQVRQAATDIRALAAKVDLYYTDTGQYPIDLTVIGCTATTCLDPWGQPYQYIDHALLHGNGHVRRDRSLNPLNNDYDLYSVGQDGLTAFPITQSVSQDDIIRAGTGAFYGLASDF
jgi:general secretion pathway protein G